MRHTDPLRRAGRHARRLWVAEPRLRSRPWITVGLATLVGTGIVIASSQIDDVPSAATFQLVPESSTAAPRSAFVPIAELHPTTEAGVLMSDDAMEFVVAGADQTSADRVPDLGGVPLVVHVSVRNRSDQPQGFDPALQKLIDTEGRAYPPDETAAIALRPVTGRFQRVEARAAVAAELVFTVPVDAVPAAVELHASESTAGAVIRLGASH